MLTPPLGVIAPSSCEQLDLFTGKLSEIEIPKKNAVASYKGLSAFHKYWGKKPIEHGQHLIQLLSKPNDIVLDPFLGSGLIARTAIESERRFLGCDLNPVAVEMASFTLSPPSLSELLKGVENVTKSVQSLIEESYKKDDGSIATHYLWERQDLIEVWHVHGRKREESKPTEHDLQLIKKWDDYQPQRLGELHLYDNSRINTSTNITFHDLFTGRALRNIELLLEAIDAQTPAVRRALSLALTSAAGQMSQMVFAITGRGKTSSSNDSAKIARVEVGSWVIGYWRPPLHFEINVWNCFSRRVRDLIKSISSCNSIEANSGTILDVIEGKASSHLALVDALSFLKSIPTDSVDLIVTDPPHSDRIPYLEMSEMWNGILGLKANFDAEIVVSNAKLRQKNKNQFTSDLQNVFSECCRILRPEGFLVVEFNARDKESWESLQTIHQLSYIGCFPLEYSARSVVQDNREGSLKSDLALVFGRDKNFKGHILKEVSKLSGWKTEFPCPA